MYCVAYKFTLLNAEYGSEFIEVWRGITDYFRDQCGALGSRLHTGEAGVYYAYAQWPSRVVFEAAGDHPPNQDFLRLRIRWAEICGPSEVFFAGDVAADMFI